MTYMIYIYIYIYIHTSIYIHLHRCICLFISHSRGGRSGPPQLWDGNLRGEPHLAGGGPGGAKWELYVYSVYIYIYIHTYIYTYIYIYVYTYIHMYMYTYIHIIVQCSIITFLVFVLLIHDYYHYT